MLAWTDPDDLQALRNACERGQLVIFAGAGISAAAGLPLWPQVAELLIERMRRQHGSASAVREAEACVRRERLVEAISIAQHNLGPTVFGDVVAKALDDRGRDVPALARAIAALRPKLHGVITTNVDRFLERAAEGQWHETVKPLGDLAQRPGYLWKAHGTLQDHSTWVFARGAYDRVMFGDAQHRATFDAVYRARTLLFVGCGLSDDDLDITLGEVRALAGGQPPRHFAILEGPLGEYRRRTLENTGIRIFEYPAGQHERAVQLLQALAAASAPANQAATGPRALTPPGGTAAPGAAAPAATGGPVHVFLCSAAPDTALRDELVKHLTPLIERRLITLWHAGKLPGGADIRRETHAQLDKAGLVLALTTSSLLALPDCNALLERARHHRIPTVPVLAQPCLWEVSDLAHAQPLPVNGEPVSAWKDRNAAWVDIVRGVLTTVKGLTSEIRS